MINNVLLLAANHIRDQRWVLATMFAYALIMSTVFGFLAGKPTPEDARFFIEQQLWFAVLFGVFLATAAVHTDMRTRRMLAILSKSVRRWEYLLGVMLGIAATLFTYCMFVAFAGRLITAHAGQSLDGIWVLASTVALAAIAVACVGLLFGVFLAPLYATAATFALVMAVPLLAIRFGPWLIAASPASYLLAETVAKGAQGAPAMAFHRIVALTLAQALMYFGLALFVFSRRDLATPTE